MIAKREVRPENFCPPEELKVNVGCLFLHTLAGSLGSFTRVKELSISTAKYGVKTRILTPYSHDIILADGVQINEIPNLALKFGLASTMYELSRKVYYNKHLSKLLTRSSGGVLMEAFVNKLAKLVKSSEIQILQAEQDFSLRACIKVKQRAGLPLVADLHNITEEELVAAGIIEREGKEFLQLQQSTADNLSFADVVIVVSDPMKEYVMSAYDIPSSKVHVVPPGGRRRVNSICVNANLHFIYSGLLSYRENVQLFVRSMPHILEKYRHSKFSITGKGEMKSDLARLASNLKVNPNFLWFSDVKDLYELLSTCYGGILPSSNDPARKMGTPAKLFDYMSFGLPIIANDIGGWTNIVSSNKAGLLTGSEPQEFADGVIRLITSNKRDEYAENALRLVTEKYNWDASALVLLQVYKELVN
jgi:glycosyltransferase involved in cell wall biosynthesis